MGSASGERSRALSQGFVKISEVESTMRLNESLEKENATLEAELALLLRQNLQLRDNIASMEGMLGITHAEDATAHDDAAPVEASCTAEGVCEQLVGNTR